MKPLALEYLELLRSELGTKFESKGLHVPMFSTVSGDCVKVSSSLSVDYWSSNLLSPVLFNSAARKLMSQFSDTVLLELGPHSTLAGPLREIVSGSGISYNYVSTLLRFSSSRDNFLSALGQLYQLGVHVDFTSLVPSQKPFTISRHIHGTVLHTGQKAGFRRIGDLADILIIHF
jgi:acyl transferase domain-containing protein